MARTINWRVVMAYALVAVLGVAPNAFALMVDAPLVETGTLPFVVFAACIAAILITLRPIYLVATLHPEPTRQLLRDVKKYAPWLMITALMMFSITQLLEGVLAVKRIIPFINPYWADDALIAIDRALFFGADAWEVSYAVLPAAVTSAIDFIYTLWHPVSIFFYTLLAVLLDRRLQLQLVLSLQLTWILMGSVLATILASVGPIFAPEMLARDDFIPLLLALEAEGANMTLATYEYLLTTRGSTALGSGISAMPSLHVGIAVLIALGVRERFPRFQLIGWLYVAVMYLGSIHLGYHYATDGAVSAIGVILIWLAVKRFVAFVFDGEFDPSKELDAVPFHNAAEEPSQLHH